MITVIGGRAPARNERVHRERGDGEVVSIRRSFLACYSTTGYSTTGDRVAASLRDAYRDHLEATA